MSAAEKGHVVATPRPQKIVLAVPRALGTVVTRSATGDAAAAVATAPRAPKAIAASPNVELQLGFLPAAGESSATTPRVPDVFAGSPCAPDAVPTRPAAGDAVAPVATSLGAGVVGPDAGAHLGATPDAGECSAMTPRASASRGTVVSVATSPGAGVMGPDAGGQLAATPDAEDQATDNNPPQ